MNLQHHDLKDEYRSEELDNASDDNDENEGDPKPRICVFKVEEMCKDFKFKARMEF